MIQTNETRGADIARKLQDIVGVTEALKKAAREAVLDHARAGLPIVIWRDHRIVFEDVSITTSESHKVTGQSTVQDATQTYLS